MFCVSFVESEDDVWLDAEGESILRRGRLGFVEKV